MTTSAYSCGSPLSTEVPFLFIQVRRQMFLIRDHIKTRKRTIEIMSVGCLVADTYVDSHFLGLDSIKVVVVW